jgi:hypothetical protein
LLSVKELTRVIRGRLTVGDKRWTVDTWV